MLQRCRSMACRYAAGVALPHTNPEDFKRLRRIEGRRDARALNFACFHNKRFLKSERAIAWVLDATRLALHEHGVDLWAWCIMPDHYHLLVYPPNVNTRISSFLSSLKTSSASRAANWVRANAPDKLWMMRDEQPNGKVAHRLWQRGGGYDRNLSSPRAIWNMIDYIHRNPVEEGLVAHPADWPWSSARTYMRGEPSALPIIPDHLPGDPRGRAGVIRHAPAGQEHATQLVPTSSAS